MLDVAVALLDMRGKLERDRLMRTRAAPARNREPNRLEVKPSPRIGLALHRRARTFGIVIDLSCSGRIVNPSVDHARQLGRVNGE
jgi:hypothetical protein